MKGKVDSQLNQLSHSQVAFPELLLCVQSKYWSASARPHGQSSASGRLLFF